MKATLTRKSRVLAPSKSAGRSFRDYYFHTLRGQSPPLGLARYHYIANYFKRQVSAMSTPVVHLSLVLAVVCRYRSASLLPRVSVPPPTASSLFAAIPKYNLLKVIQVVCTALTRGQSEAQSKDQSTRLKGWFGHDSRGKRPLVL